MKRILSYAILIYSFSLTLQAMHVDTSDSFTRLCAAIRRNALEEIKTIIVQDKPDINAYSTSGFTPLHIACTQGNVAIISYLLDNGAHTRLLAKKTESDMNFKEIHAYMHLENASSLSLATYNNHFEAVKRLVAHDPLIDLEPHETPPMVLACFQNNPDMISFFHERHARTVNNKGINVYHAATMANNPDIILHLDKLGIPCIGTNEDGYTALHNAAYTGLNKAVISYFITHGLDPNQTTPEGLTPLYLAAEHGRDHVIKRLLQEHVEPSLYARSSVKFMPIHIAAFKGNHQALQLLYGAMKEKTPHILLITGGKQKMSFAHLIAQNGTIKSIETLIDLLKDTAENPQAPAYVRQLASLEKMTHMRAEFSIDPIVFTAKHGNTEILQYYIQHGFQINPSPGSQISALSAAAVNDHAPLVQAIFDAGGAFHQIGKDNNASLFSIKKTLKIKKSPQGFTPLCNICAHQCTAQYHQVTIGWRIEQPIHETCLHACSDQCLRELKYRAAVI